MLYIHALQIFTLYVFFYSPAFYSGLKNEGLALIPALLKLLVSFTGTTKDILADFPV